MLWPDIATIGHNGKMATNFSPGGVIRPPKGMVLHVMGGIGVYDGSFAWACSKNPAASLHPVSSPPGAAVEKKSMFAASPLVTPERQIP